MKKMVLALSLISASFLGAVALEDVSRDVLVEQFENGVAVDDLKARVMTALDEGVVSADDAAALCQELDELATL